MSEILAEHVPPGREITLLKIDVERAEEQVLRGICEEDWTRVRQLAMEAHETGDGSVAAVRRLLEARGYRVEVDQDPALEGTPLFNLYATRT